MSKKENARNFSLEWEGPLYGRVFLVLIPAIFLSGLMYMSQSYFGVGIFAMIGVVGVLLILRSPKQVSCKLSDNKVICENKSYPFSFFEGFALRENAIILIPKQKTRKPLRLPIGNDSAQGIIDSVSVHLTEIEYEESPGDFVNQFFRL